MNLYKELLLKFRDLELSKRELLKTIPSNFHIDEPIIVSNEHVIHLLESYRGNIIDESFLLDWVNTVWFKEWFDYRDEDSECIACILNELEEIDEYEHELNSDKVEKYIFALKNNLEV